jgi:hypothetical protein
VARCGAFPENIELSLTGQGIDTEGGLNTAVFSACTNTAANEVFDLKATHIYVGSGDQAFLEADFLYRRSTLLTARLLRRMQFHSVLPEVWEVMQVATGQGRFNLYSNLTPFNGQTPPAFVSFEGMIQVPQKRRVF